MPTDSRPAQGPAFTFLCPNCSTAHTVHVKPAPSGQQWPKWPCQGCKKQPRVALATCVACRKHLRLCVCGPARSAGKRS
eukprot:11918222-Alexandrium_andersonii.AAC.1